MSHRGEHDNRAVPENSLAAFDAARRAGVWGIECDIRWTADLVPIICHDSSPHRVFGLKTPLSMLSFSELRLAVPQIPTLEEVIAEFSKDCHFMLELKDGYWPEPERQQAQLADLLSGLRAGWDYHVLALQAGLFRYAGFAPTTCYLPVAEFNIRQFSALAIKRGYAGVAGHYLLLTRELHRRHRRRGQKLGSGFPRSRSGLFRELNRGTDWIFTNHAVALQHERDQALALFFNEH